MICDASEGAISLKKFVKWARVSSLVGSYFFTYVASSLNLLLSSFHCTGSLKHLLARAPQCVHSSQRGRYSTSRDLALAFFGRLHDRIHASWPPASEKPA